MSDLAAAVRPLLGAVLAGDRKARTAVWVLIEPVVRHYVHRCWGGATRQDREDLVQDLARKLVMGAKPALRRWKPHRALKPWLRRVVLNAVRNRVAGRNGIETADAAAIGAAVDRRAPSPIEHVLARERVEIVRQEIAAMSPTDAAILRGILYGKLTHAEAAARLGKKPKTAQRAVKRLSDRVRKRLGDDGLGA